MASRASAGTLAARNSSPRALDVELLLPSSIRQSTDGFKSPLPDSVHLKEPWTLDKQIAHILPSWPLDGLARVLLQVGIACLGAYLFGYHLSVVNGPLDQIAGDLGFATNSMAKGSVVSAFLVGAFFGCTLSSEAADGLGRRRAFLATALPVLLGSSMSAISSSFAMMVIGRIIVGFGLGIGSPLPNMYISEIAPSSLRGTLNSLPQVASCIGILIALAAGVYFPTQPQGWRWCFWLGSVPAAVLVFLSEYMTESPRWLAQKGQFSAAEKALESLQGSTPGLVGQQEMADLKLAASSPAASVDVSLKELFSKQYRKLIMIGCALFALQQLSGINSVFYFSSSIFKHAGITSEVVASMAVGVANLAAAVLSTFLIDRAGRKTLLLSSFAAMGLSLAAQVLCNVICSQIPSLSWIAAPVSLTSTLLYVMAFAVGAGPVPGLLLPEIYPTKIRAKGFAVALSVYWVFNCALGLSFLPLLESCGFTALNIFFAIMCFVAALFTHHFIIETKGKSLEEVEAAMMQR